MAGGGFDVTFITFTIKGGFVQTVADRNPSFRFLAEPCRFDDDEAYLIEQCLVKVGLEHFVCILTFVHFPDHAYAVRLGSCQN
uniref:Uncharacterized protein n=1 Tax=Anopheles epiroticus TaxID=199890 RepID=A0A182PWA2_9DIPT